VSDLQSTLDAIDQLAVHQCGHCQEPLAEDSTSLDFCSNVCQTAWTRNKHEIVALLDYEEPTDLAAHVSNLVELRSPETTPRPEREWWFTAEQSITAWVNARRRATGRTPSRDHCPCPACRTYRGIPRPAPTEDAQGWLQASARDSIGITRPEDLPNPRDSRVVLGFDGARGQTVTVSVVDEVYVWVAPDTTQLQEAGRRAAEQISAFIERLQLNFTQWQRQQLEHLERARIQPVVWTDEIRHWMNQPVDAQPAAEPVEPSPMQRALELRRNRNTGPAARQRAPRRIDARRTR
jgi:hypothetical protein